MSYVRRFGVAIAVISAVLSAAPSAIAATHRVECGQFFTYTAPDPAGPTDGDLTLGLLTPWVVAADATISAEDATMLPSITGGNVTCLGFDLDGTDRITTLISPITD